MTAVAMSQDIDRAEEALLRHGRDVTVDQDDVTRGLVQLVAPHIQHDTMVAVMGDAASGAHHRALAQLRELHGIKLEPTGVPGLDLAARAVLVRYPRRPWSPRMIPAATDRVVSVWRVA